MVFKSINALAVIGLLFLFSCATEKSPGRDIASMKLSDISKFYSLELYNKKLDLSKARSFEDNLADLEYIVVSPVEFNKYEIDPDSAAFICSSLGYTYLAGATIKPCSQQEHFLVSALEYQTYPNKTTSGAGTAVSFATSKVQCYASNPMPVLKAVRCAKPKN